jgi:hypothetical protein
VPLLGLTTAGVALRGSSLTGTSGALFLEAINSSGLIGFAEAELLEAINSSGVIFYPYLLVEAT